MKFLCSRSEAGGGYLELEGLQLVEAHRFALCAHFDPRQDEACGSELLQVDLQQRPADFQVACELAYIPRALRERRYDSETLRVRQSAEELRRGIAVREFS